VGTIARRIARADGVGRRKSASVPLYCPDWILLSALARDVDLALGRYAKGSLLDVGCGARPYEDAKYGLTRWIGFDTEDNAVADVHGVAYDIPLAAESVETVLCTQVLEHLETPAVALAEFHRVLKSGGHVILTVPQYWPLHEEPRDFFRYTEIGLAYTLQRSGFEVVEHRKQGRGAMVAAQALNNAILCAGDTFAFKDALAFKASKAPFYLAINVAGTLLGTFLRTGRDVLNHLVVAKKVVT
jgi:SAM-dependent methyltransferase